MPDNVPMNISKVLAEQSANTQLTPNQKLDPELVALTRYGCIYMKAHKTQQT